MTSHPTSQACSEDGRRDHCHLLRVTHVPFVATEDQAGCVPGQGGATHRDDVGREARGGSRHRQGRTREGKKAWGPGTRTGVAGTRSAENGSWRHWPGRLSRRSGVRAAGPPGLGLGSARSSLTDPEALLSYL